MKSHVSDYLEVMQAIYIDTCIKCAVKVSERDLKTIRSRVEDQGVSFLTITLPLFAVDFERSLANGFIDSKSFRSFRKFRSIPAFLRGMTSLIFDTETGRINDENNTPNRHSILVEGVRQICLAFKKIKLPCTPEREAKAIRGFIATEREFDAFTLAENDIRRFADISFLLWSGLIVSFDTNDILCKHGPGQTADRISGNRKYAWRKWHDRLEPYFPLIGNGFPNTLGLHPDAEELEKVSIIPEEEEIPSRVTLVPKTLKSPRVIAMEPCCMQLAQQGIQTWLTARIESHWRTSGQINFSDQSINQSLALSSSSDGRLATIDLSDASDRVPHELVRIMIQWNQDFLDSVESCRSKRVELPNGELIHLRKFASMGSALCFPIEAMYFYTICVMALVELQNLPVSRDSVNMCCRDVYVYGDDIIVPAVHAASILKYLEKYNCKVNTRKTFYTGKFRESCGVDAYDGVRVTPVYVNTAPPVDRRSEKELLSWVATANNFFRKKYLHTSDLFFKKVEKILGNLPPASPEAPFLARNHSWPFKPSKVRWNKRLQRQEMMAWVTAPVYRSDKLEGYAALAKSLAKLEGLTTLREQRDAAHLERTALYGRVAIKRRWVPTTFVGLDV